MDIINRDNYYYLRNSFRKDRKVTYREIYLGKEIPKDIEIIKESFLRKCMAEDLFLKLDKIKKNFSKEWKSYPASIKKIYLIDLSIDFTYNTNAIEGSKISKEETEDIIIRRISPNKKPVDDIKETERHSKVFFKAIQYKGKISLTKLLMWHKELFEETKHDIAGKVREYSVKIGNYRAPDWQDLLILMKGFLDWHSKNKKVMHPVELAARAHYKFEKIHPFGDGNGRIGRLLISYILAGSGYPLITITYKNRKPYYHALEKTETDFLNYFMRRYLKEHKIYLI